MSSGTCILCLFVLGAFGVQIQTVAGEERSAVTGARVMMSEKFNNKGNTRDAKCEQPIENIKLFMNCRADKNEGAFPASSATCDCANCYKSFKLRCKDNGKWYPEVIRFCDRSNQAVQCGKCSNLRLPKELKCSKDKYNGYLNENRYCKCKDSCKDVRIKCSGGRNANGNGNWIYVGTNCKDVAGLSRYIKTQHLNVTYNRNMQSYSYTCAKGYELHGEKSTQCLDGVMKLSQPKCVKLPEASTTPTRRTELQTSTSQKVTTEAVTKRPSTTPTTTIAATASTEPQTSSSQETVLTTNTKKQPTTASPSTEDLTTPLTLKIEPLTSTVELSTTEPTATTTENSPPPDVPVFTTTSILDIQQSTEQEMITPTIKQTETSETSSPSSSPLEPSSSSPGPEPRTSTLRELITTESASQTSTQEDVPMTSSPTVVGTFPPQSTSDVTTMTFKQTETSTKPSSTETTQQPSTSFITEHKDDFTTSTEVTFDLTTTTKSTPPSTTSIPITTTVMLKTTSNFQLTQPEILFETTTESLMSTKDSDFNDDDSDFGVKEIIPNEHASPANNTVLVSSLLIVFIIFGLMVLLCIIIVKKRRVSQRNEDINEKHNMAYMDTLIRHPHTFQNNHQNLNDVTGVDLQIETESFIIKNTD